MTPRSSQSRRRGTVAVIAAFALVPILLMSALVLDGGVLMSRRRQTQAVADAAAHAASCLLAINYAADGGADPQGKARAAALAFASANGYTNSTGTSSVTVNIPPTSGKFAGKSGNVEVIVTYYQPRGFSAIIDTSVIPVTARSVGRVVSNTPTSILLTDTSAAGALTLTGSARITTSGGIQVNSTNAGAVNASNGAYATDNGGMNIAGGYSIPNWATSSTFFKNAPAINQAALSDPYASLAPPNAASLGAGTGPALPYGNNSMSPGVFNGGITLGGGSTITMNPGIYYMKNGGFTVGNGVQLTGTGVMIYIDSGGGAINLQGGTTINLTAPTSGTYSGIAYFQDRNNTSLLNNIANGATVNMTGTLYAPNAALTIAGGASGTQYGSQFIVKSLNLSNGINITINTPTSASSTKPPFLAE